MNTWNEIFSANLGKIMAIQIACAEHVVKNRDWNVDFDRGIISFGNDEYPLQFLGSEATSSNTWLWAWENINEFDDKIISLAREIKAKGEKLNLEALTTAEIDISDELNGHTLSIVACGLADKNYCYYRGPHSGGAILVAIDGVDEKVFSSVSAKDFVDITIKCIQQFSLNHKIFVESFLEWNKTKYKMQGDTIIADFEKDGKLMIELEKIENSFRIKNISLNS
ncbi:DUF6882 domain-containing protein [Fusobacterium hwasookii]|uniref:DUF1828 domain-containing protein n=1 Tax=Fusobacterium hwasookii ChDC F128 TaxID=1216362 RepID=A0ABP2R669_9FUSO|nr:DUF6882 domain-containing protein [Fusobacterium hwasookii]EJU08472.1 hypothetical protein B437_00040 [Fusobacterium hwasookii ChDC F128]QNE67237.1 hypothetical protein H5V36_05065 [Fusobacterium hwasookii]